MKARDRKLLMERLVAERGIWEISSEVGNPKGKFQKNIEGDLLLETENKSFLIPVEGICFYEENYKPNPTINHKTEFLIVMEDPPDLFTTKYFFKIG